MSVRRDDAVPLYHQIFLTLRDEIVTGRRSYGSGMPTEHELADSLGVSRITARRALDELAGQGFVERRRRTGTKVVYNGSAAPIEANLEQAVESLLEFGRNTKVRVIEFGPRAADPQTAALLGIEPDASVLHALRLRLADNEPLGQIESFVPAKLGGAITRKSLTTTPLLAILRQSGAVIGGGRQIISAGTADVVLASRLAIEPRATILRVERIVTDGAGRPLLLTVAQYRGDRYRINLDLQDPARATSRRGPSR